ncbi:MAG TPA: hypothetical protein VMY99_02240 [Nevskiaceae bacterium]|nr:hypothetical protein [Nevskiaceae bacterium]
MSNNDHKAKHHKPQHPPLGQVFDVSRPGKAPAHPGARPIIVGHKPQVRDEKIGGTVSAFGSDHPSKRPLMDAGKKVALKPVEPAPSEKPEISAAEPPPLKPESQQTTSAPAKEQTPPPRETILTQADDDTEFTWPPPDLQKTAPAKKEAPKPNPVANPQLLLSDKQRNATASVASPVPAHAQPDPEISDDLLSDTNAPLIDPSKIVVSRHKRNHPILGTIFIVLVILLLAAAVVDVLLDTGTLTIDLNIPHTNLFNQY